MFFVYFVLFIHISYNSDKSSSNDADNFWIVNDSIFISSLLPMLKEIRNFAVISGEVIIVDFSHFPLGTNKYGCVTKIFVLNFLFIF